MPTIVAEALFPVAEPLATALRPGPSAAATSVAAALARTLAPPEAPDAAPRWLWPEQEASFRRAVAAVRSYGGAVLADPVGTGKTYVALAVAAAFNRHRPTICLVPAALADQWSRTAASLGTDAIVWSHERVSRGALPEPKSRLVVVDESHHYRNPDTQRYRQLAPWLVGRRALLVSATPVVNRLADLRHQLLLAVRDDALGPHGIASLSRLLESGRGHPALGCIVLARASASSRRPEARGRIVSLDDAVLAPLADALARVDRLRLSTDGGVAALVRATLWRAAASSPPALLASLSRYRRLLLHASDARRAGRTPDRRALRRLTGGLDDQLLFWELIPAADAAPDLALDDLPALDALISRVATAARGPDLKLARLRALVGDERPTLVFATARATVRHLRDGLGPRPIAWCTGDRAGLGRQPAPRRAVLDWFGPHAASRPAPGADDAAALRSPLHLVVTDVAAEGLDLPRAERVVHYDLPWTPARMDQREGRARRAGCRHNEVEVVRFEPPPVVEARLRQLACLAGKRRLPPVAGLHESGRGLWAWRIDLADRFAGRPAREGMARIEVGPPGLLAGFSMSPWPDAPNPAGQARIPAHGWVVWLDAVHGWTEDPVVLSARLEIAAGFRRVTRPSDAEITAALERLAPPIRRRMAEMRQARWLDGPVSAGEHRFIARLQQMASRAARRRDFEALARVQRAIRFASGGHTAGEAALVTRLAGAPARTVVAALPALPDPTPTWDAVQCRLTGLIVFAPIEGPAWLVT